ncbi:hypothetical protein SODALDRAFT_68997 [Sodiomyces alkalinus F11]|uniref:Aminodeoxychorismate lyase n=1 Tax=Sodiomyces alkalinus (strain CBS 110278 / VKM F-3762 / F11) TaxID=1314773 RepID=A0A3N2PMG1_SODAK|nr:hypothetical protein SODALDRAFT_68997 [Sodiomyces alkalinus F11]ROT35526.1 hypothetical protein SODALDRAFT_68997 [Sodiomyces alkalinus F11]
MVHFFQLFTSLRYDTTLCSIPDKYAGGADWNFKSRSPLYMLDYHRDRMLRAATHWGWTAAIESLQGDAGLARLTELMEPAASTKPSPLRVKILLTKDGQLSCEMGPTLKTSLQNLFPSRLPPPGAANLEGDPLRDPIYDVVPDSAQTARSEFTHFKTTERSIYDGARSRVSIQLTDLKEVLLVNNADGSIMEGSMTTPYFWRDGRWATPPVPSKFSWDAGSGGQDGTSRRWALSRGLAVEEVVSVDSLVDGEECWISNGVRGFCCGRLRLNP